MISLFSSSLSLCLYEMILLLEILLVTTLAEAKDTTSLFL